MCRHVEVNLSPTTVEGYRKKIKYLGEEVLAVSLPSLSPLALEREYQRLRAEGGHKGKDGAAKPLSGRTVGHVAGVVKAALGDVVRLGEIQFNPALACRRPPVERREKAILDVEQLQALLLAAKGTRLGALLELSAATGCRRGELLALTHEDLQLDEGCLRITKSLEQTKAGLRIKSPKNGRSRCVFLPDGAIAVLRMHIAEQEQAALEFGDAYQREPRLVFADPVGRYLRPNSITAEVCRLARTCGFKGISLHSLRHTHGSLLLSAGVPLPAVSARLGHSSPAVTANIYSHATARDLGNCAPAWDRLTKGTQLD
jgi:integrase